jgi:hypothetical protein
MDLLRHLVEPARLIAACKTDHRPALGQLIEPRDFEGEPQRIPSGEHVADRPRHDPFRVMENMLREYGQAAHLDPFAVQVMLGIGDRREAGILGDLREFDDFLDHFLPAIGMHRDRPKLTALFERGR